MLILVVRTDKPESEIGLYDGVTKMFYKKWHAHFDLAETIHTKVSKLLNEADIKWHNLNGIVIYKGPGSFTGLRIGIAFANTLSYSLNIPIIGSSGDDWVVSGIKELLNHKNDKTIVPEYGADVHITVPKR